MGAVALAALLALGEAGAPLQGVPSTSEQCGSASSFGGESQDSLLIITGLQSACGDGASPATRTDAPDYVTRRLEQHTCGGLDSEPHGSQMCVDGAASTTVTRLCADGTDALPPLFRQELDAQGKPFGPWTQVDNGWCPEDPDTTTILTAEDFRRLPLTPSTPQYQPADGQGLVNVNLIVYTDPAPQTLTTTVLGTPVTVLATPTQWAWDFGDDTEPLVTTDPGQPYPNQTVARPYTQPGTYQVQVTTTWTGQFQINNTGPWYPVLGTATTTSTPFTTQVYEAHAHLVTGTTP